MTSPALDPDIDVAAALRDIIEELSGFFLEREKTLTNVALSLLTRSHHFLLGPVGAGKTYLLEQLASRIGGANFFSVQLDQQMSKDDLFGPIDIVRFERDNVWERDTTGYLPWAHLALLDEPGKAGATTLTPMLRVMNERRFRNGKTEMHLPLMTVVGGSNELLDLTTLRATWDRFLIREEVDYLREPANVRSLLRAGHPSAQGATSITLAELQWAQWAVTTVTIDEDVEDRLLAIREQLRGEAVIVSDRRLRASLDLLRAHAWLADSAGVRPEDLLVLRDVFWESPEQRTVVNEVVLEHAGDITRALAEVTEIVESVAAEIRERAVMPGGAAGLALRNYAPDAGLKLRAAKEALVALGDDPRVEAALVRYSEVKGLMMSACFGVAAQR